jgi:hypothetical protein
VEVEHDVRAVAEEYAIFGGHARRLEAVDLGEEGGQVHDDAVPDDARRVRVEYAGGQEVELVLFAVDDDGVPGVGSAGDAGADVVLLFFFADRGPDILYSVRWGERWGEREMEWGGGGEMGKYRN